MPLLNESEVRDFWSSIAAAGYSNDNFELMGIEEKAQRSGGYALRGKAIVRRKTTSVTREYPADHMTAWVPEFDVELRGGAYGPA